MAYKSKYEELMTDALNKVGNREKFSYDFNADPMYQMYKDQYTKLGNEAAMNAAANVSALTGGYGNSYATTAAAQANQQYLTELNKIIPELNQQALAKYQMEGQDLKDMYSLYADAENRDYSKYRDEVADKQWQDQFDYGKERDKVSDEQWQKNYDQALKQFEESVRQYNNNFDYSKSRDAIADERYAQEWQYAKDRDAAEDARWREQFDYSKSRDAVSDSQWQAEYDESKRRYDQEWQAQLEAQQAARALAQARLNAQNSGSVDTEATLSRNAQSNIDFIRREASKISKGATSSDTALNAFGDYLDTLVSGKKITQEDADILLKKYAYNKLV